MPSLTNRQWRLRSRPQGDMTREHFRWTEQPVAEPGDGEFRVRVRYLSLDPTHRLWVREAPSYFPPVPLGEVMWGSAVGVVEASRHLGFAEGTLVAGRFGFQDYAMSNGAGVMPLPEGIGPVDWFGAYAHIGLTAYFGMMDVAGPKPGETVVVSGAAGAVGSLAGQMARILGCRVVGIAGSEEKCRWLREDLGFDGVINYRAEPVADALHRLCPEGIDVYFDNVGGETLDAVLLQLRLHARVALCGMISQYNQGTWQGPANLGELIFKRAKIEGFLVMDYLHRSSEAIKAISGWLREGKLKYRVDVVNGLENALDALGKLFQGTNQGKLLVRVAGES